MIHRNEGRGIKVSTNLKVNPKCWNCKSHNVKKGTPNSKLINDVLSDMELKVKRAEHKRKVFSLTYTLDQIRAEVVGKKRNRGIKKSITGFLEYFISTKGNVLREGSIKSYRYAL